MDSSPLPEFLLARIAEDADIQLTDPAGHCDMLDGAHYSPDRVLAECEAKRRIIDEHPTAQAYADNGALVDECRRCSSHSYEGLDDEVVEYPCPTLRLLALPYADHPEFREEWRPC